MQIKPPITYVTAFIDWNSQIHAAKPPRDSDPLELCRYTLEFVGKTIGRVLDKIESQNRYNVSLRLYHGWHKGFTITPRRKALVTLAAGVDFTSLSNRSNVVIRPEVAFGDALISANSLRLHTRLGCHLPNTVRNDGKSNTDLEKMIDTSIASDFVDLAHSDKRRWLMLFGEDDDLVPPVFVAEGVRGRGDGRILLVRARTKTPFLKLDNLQVLPC